MKIKLTQEEIVIVLGALDDYEQEMSDQGRLAELVAASRLYRLFDKLRCS